MKALATDVAIGRYVVWRSLLTTGLDEAKKRTEIQLAAVPKGPRVRLRESFTLILIGGNGQQTEYTCLFLQVSCCLYRFLSI